MYAHVQCPESLSPHELDGYLARGWFRMGQTIFTTNFLNFNNELYSAVWLRVRLKDFTSDRVFDQLGRMNARFTVSFQRANINREKEELYARYRSSVGFHASASVQALMYGSSSSDIYQTQEVTVRDGKRLIATGFFDVGRSSVAGITCFYDPLYKRNSLGKYLMFLKLIFCRDLGYQYFYPGYFVPGYRPFDYKLKIGRPAIEFLNVAANTWDSMSVFSPENIPIESMKSRLHTLRSLLAERNIASRVLKYEFFDANIIPDLNGIVLFDYPLFLGRIEGYDSAGDDIIVFDVRDHKFHVLRCISLWQSNLPEDLHDIFSSDLLKVSEVRFSSGSEHDVVHYLSTEQRSLRAKRASA